MASRDEVFSVLDGERKYQLDKWGPAADEKMIASYIAYMQHHLNQALALASTTSPETVSLDQIRKVTALGVACMEQWGAPKRETA